MCCALMEQSGMSLCIEEAVSGCVCTLMGQSVDVFVC